MTGDLKALREALRSTGVSSELTERAIREIAETREHQLSAFGSRLSDLGKAHARSYG